MQCSHMMNSTICRGSKKYPSKAVKPLQCPKLFDASTHFPFMSCQGSRAFLQHALCRTVLDGNCANAVTQKYCGEEPHEEQKANRLTGMNLDLN